MSPWHHITDRETAHEHDLFCRWLYSGADYQAMRRVAKSANVSTESIQLLAEAKCWELRAQHWRAWISTVQDKAAADAAVSIGRAKVAALALATAAVEEAKAVIDLEKEMRPKRHGGHSAISINEALRVAMRAPAAIASLAPLLPEDSTEVDDVDYSRLSVEELALYRTLHLKAQRKAG